MISKKIYIDLLIFALSTSANHCALAKTIKLECHLGPNDIGMTHDITLVVDMAKKTINGPSITKEKDGNSISTKSTVSENTLYTSETMKASNGAMSDIRLTVDRISGRATEDQHIINPEKNFDKTNHLEGNCQRIERNKF
jgi:hypothetical protein